MKEIIQHKDNSFTITTNRLDTIRRTVYTLSFVYLTIGAIEYWFLPKFKDYSINMIIISLICFLFYTIIIIYMNIVNKKLKQYIRSEVRNIINKHKDVGDSIVDDISILASEFAGESKLSKHVLLNLIHDIIIDEY